ncbi:helix-turn-helix domain-containing protein [Kitasatospora sp. NPDC097691]|uniref:helix-turn-helix domain-containing protein n=1 Tax=Kitasatospora sp. NPDC097691 TaxID=3157231 RepID=UPI00332EAFB2
MTGARRVLGDHAGAQPVHGYVGHGPAIGTGASDPSRTAPLRRIQRARVALAAADGVSNAAIARATGVHIATIRRWRKRFHCEGMAGLDDRTRPGRPRRYGPEVQLAIVATRPLHRPPGRVLPAQPGLFRCTSTCSAS